MKKALIIGGGAAGCSAAHQLTLMGGWDVTLVEAAAFLGAGVRTSWFGGHPYTFGPRHFLTQNRKVLLVIVDTENAWLARSGRHPPYLSVRRG